MIMEEENLIGVFIRGYDFWRLNDIVLCSDITVSLIDKTTGDCASQVSRTIITDPVLSTLASRQYHILPRNSSPTNERLLIIEENISALNSNEKILIFEICKNVSTAGNFKSEKRRIAWAFLVPTGNDGNKNIDKELKLQLYKTGRKCHISHHTCNVYHLYKDHKLKKIDGVLYVEIRGVYKKAEQEELVNMENFHEEIGKSIEAETKEDLFTQNIFKWSRLPTQSCKIPNQIHKTLNLGSKGSSCVSFSPSGTRLAVSSGYRIIIYDTLSGTELLTLTGHNGFIYNLEWSENDIYLLSSSNDCTAIIWNVIEKIQVYFLPHPSFVYCGIWINSDDKIVTGCKDHLLRYWAKKDENFELIEEIRGHSGFVTSIACHSSNMLVSGDSMGSIRMHTFHENRWTAIRHLELNEMSHGIIDAIHIFNSGSRMIVMSRSKGIFMVDLRAGIIVLKYKATVNIVLRSTPCLTPCESLIFAFCQNGEIGVWNSYTGKRLASYENLYPVEGISEICGSIHYNPFEHMIAIAALDHNYPVWVLKYGVENHLKQLEYISDNDEKKNYNKIQAHID